MSAARQRRGSGLPLVAGFVFALFGIAVVLVGWRIAQGVADLAQARAQRLAAQVAEEIERGFLLGLAPAAQTSLPRLLAQLARDEPALTGGLVVDDAGGRVAGFGAAESVRFAAWTARLASGGQTPAARRDGRQVHVAALARDPVGRAAAVVWLTLDLGFSRDAALRAAGRLALLACGLALAWLGLLAWLMGPWVLAAARRLHAAGRPGPAVPSAPRARALPTAVLLFALASLTVLALAARDLARPLMAAEAERNAGVAATAIASQIRRAVEIGVPLARLPGLDAVLDDALAAAPELAYLAVVADGRVLAATARLDAPLQRAAPLPAQPALAQARVAVADVAEVVAAYPLALVDRIVAQTLLDMLLALVVALVLAGEFGRAAWNRAALRPLLAFEWARASAAAGGPAWPDRLRRWRSDLRPGADARDKAALGAQVKLRLLVFLVALSDELVRPFFALHAVEVAPLDPRWSPSVLAGVPITAFMLTLALAQPLGSALARRLPLGPTMAAAAAVGAVLLGLTARADDGATLLALRAASGFVYGLLLILAQAALLRITTRASRARTLADVPAAIVAAGIVGPALGGLGAELLGAAATFLLCALCMAGALAVALLLPRLPAADPAARVLHLRQGLAAALRHPRILAVTWLAAIPARLAAAALLAVLVPLYLDASGASPLMAGRVLALYFVAFMLMVPLVALHSDRSGRRRSWVVGGSAVSALACALLPLLAPSLGPAWAAAIGCAMLGLGQALLSAPQLALVTEAVERERRAGASADAEHALAAFRLLERLGSIAAPLAVAAAVPMFGLAGTAGMFGAILAVATLLLWLALSTYREGEP
jgi:MFS family permease